MLQVLGWSQHRTECFPYQDDEKMPSLSCSTNLGPSLGLHFLGPHVPFFPRSRESSVKDPMKLVCAETFQ